MEPITTIYHAYHFDVHEEAEAKAYEELSAKLKGQGLECFETWGQGSHYQPDLDGRVLTLETSHLFENQWNTAPTEGSESGLRVFDWAQDYPISTGKHIKRGHYLDQTPAMAEIRRNMNKCGYCGKMEPAAKGYVFCPHCLDSEYLKESDLLLTRMRPIDHLKDKFMPLTDAERDYLLPLYREAQLHGATDRGKARLAKQRQDILSKHAKTVNNATYERDGLIWLLDHGVKVDNVIFYDHRGIFSFGWRSPVSASVKSALLDILVEFEFPYEIKAEDETISTVAA